VLATPKGQPPNFNKIIWQRTHRRKASPIQESVIARKTLLCHLSDKKRLSFSTGNTQKKNDTRMTYPVTRCLAVQRGIVSAKAVLGRSNGDKNITAALFRFCLEYSGYIGSIKCPHNLPYRQHSLFFILLTVLFNFGLSPMLIGLTIVSIGTSAPEILISLVAATSGYGSLAVGNAIGSNITNIGLVLGITVTLVPFPIKSDQPVSGTAGDCLRKSGIGSE
jgi:hypothetical protein